MPRPFRRSRLLPIALVWLALPACTWFEERPDKDPFVPPDDATTQSAPLRARCAYCLGTGKRAKADGTAETSWFAPKCPECQGTGWR